MKNKLFILLVLIFSSFCFAEENDMQESQVDLEQSHNQLLEIINEDLNNNDSLKILQENSEQYIQKNEEIVQEKEEIEEAKRKIVEEKKKVRKEKRENKFYSYYTFAVDLPLTYQKDVAFDFPLNSPSPFGISIGMLSALQKWSFKANINWDFYNLQENSLDVLSLILSAGRAPIHNDYLFLGYFFTLGLAENVGDYNYISIGGSGSVVYNFSKNWGLYLNLDAIYRISESFDGEKVTDPMLSSILKDTWKINTSVGFSFRM